jgi:DNA-directed RNA polymerase specialized sigma24 family protein
MSTSTETPNGTRYGEVEDCTWKGAGKCLHVQCRYSLLQERPQITEWDPDDFDDLVAALPSTCALDLADLEGMRLEEVAMVMGMARQRIEQLEILALRKLAKSREIRKARWDGR